MAAGSDPLEDLALREAECGADSIADGGESTPFAGHAVAIGASAGGLDAQGTIVRIDAAWRQFAVTHGDPDLQTTGVGSNCLQVRARASHDGVDARAACDGLADVLAGRRASFTPPYPCAVATRRLWFLMQAAQTQEPDA